MTKKIKHLEPGRPARSGQFILERRYRIVTGLLGRKADWERILDIGCGNAAQSVYFLANAKTIVGLDNISHYDIEDFKNHEGLHRVQANALELPFQPDSFDAVTCFEVLEHLSDDEAGIREIHRILKKNGLFILSVPNRWWLFESHGAIIPGLQWIPWNRVPFVSWLPKRIHDRFAKARIYMRSEFLDMLQRNGFDPIHSGYITAPLDVLPEGFTRRLLRKLLFRRDVTLNPLKAVNIFAIARKTT